jgi:PAS domain S-box-containing protein
LPSTVKVRRVLSVSCPKLGTGKFPSVLVSCGAKNEQGNSTLAAQIEVHRGFADGAKVNTFLTFCRIWFLSNYAEETAIRPSLAHSLDGLRARAQPNFGRVFNARLQRRAMAAFGAIVVLGIAWVFATNTKVAYEQAQSAALNEAQLQVRLLEEHIVRSLEIAVVLTGEIARESEGPDVGSGSFAHRIDAYRALIADARSLAFYAPDGRAVANRELPPLASELRNRLMHSPIGSLAILRDSEPGVLIVARRVAAGLLVLHVGTDYLSRDFENSKSRPMALLLQNRDGTALASYPPSYADLDVQTLARSPPANWFTALGGGSRGAFLVQHALENVPLQAAALYDHESYLAPYRELAAKRALRGVAVSAAMLGFVWLVAAQFGRLARLDAVRLRQRAKIIESRRRLREIIDAIPAIVNAKDTHGRYTLMNAYHARVFGISPDQAIGRRLEDFVAPAFAAEVRAREQARIQAGIGGGSEDTFVVNGQPRSFYANKVPLLDAAGNVEGLVTVAFDVTDLKSVERKATAAEVLLRTALDSIPEGFAIFDDDDKLVIANRPYARMFSKFEDPAKLEGLTFADMVRLSMRLGEPPEPGFEGEVWVAERVRRHLELSAVPRLLQVAGGRWVSTFERRVPGIGIVGFRADVTQEIETQSALRQARDAAEAANRAKSQFLANMSHELRTPLNAIIGFSEVIESEMFGPVGNKRYAEYASDIAASGRHLVALIGDVLDMSKIEAGGYELEESQFHVDAWLGATRALMRGHAHARSQLLAVDAAALDGAVLRADSRALRQVMINLLSNAIKFSPTGGQVQIEARVTSAALEIAVHDAGIGISPEELAHVAEPFRQAQGVANRFGGTGLGLSISKRLVELHGGQLTIESKLGAGTTVRVALPLHRVVGRTAA